VEARPLDDARKWHYRLEKHTSEARTTYDGRNIPAADFFDVCLYHTTMARYHKPEADGTRRVDYTNHSSPTSGQFKGCVTRMNDVMRYGTTLVPIAYKELGTTIWLGKDGKLIKEKSSHQPMYKYATSPEQKEWKARLRESTKNLALLFEMGMAGMVSTPSSPKNGWGRHKGNDAGNRLFYNELRRWDGELTADTTHETVEALRQLWESCLQMTINRRDYKDGSNAAPINPKSITIAWVNKLYDKLCPHRKDSVRLPDFPTVGELPKAFHF
jgi:hypothetical protein